MCTGGKVETCGPAGTCAGGSAPLENAAVADGQAEDRIERGDHDAAGGVHGAAAGVADPAPPADHAVARRDREEVAPAGRDQQDAVDERDRTRRLGDPGAPALAAGGRVEREEIALRPHARDVHRRVRAHHPAQNAAGQAKAPAHLPAVDRDGAHDAIHPGGVDARGVDAERRRDRTPGAELPHEPGRRARGIGRQSERTGVKVHAARVDAPGEGR